MLYVLIGLGGVTVLLLLIILGLLASLGSAVADIENTNLLRDGIAATFDEGRMHAMLTAGAAFATKAGAINWELDPDRDRELCHTGTSSAPCYPLGGQSQCNAQTGCWWDGGVGYCDGWYTASTQQCDIEIDAGTQDDIEEVCEKAADAMVRRLPKPHSSTPFASQDPDKTRALADGHGERHEHRGTRRHRPRPELA